MTIIGVLALQGDFAEHGTRLEELGAEPRRVRLPEDLDGLDGLIIPGGETTTFDRLLSLYGLAGPVRRLADSGVPVWGTCAGLIALAERVVGRDRALIGMLDVEVERNAYGRQVDSFETDIDVPALGGRRLPRRLYPRAEDRGSRPRRRGAGEPARQRGGRRERRRGAVRPGVGHGVPPRADRRRAVPRLFSEHDEGSSCCGPLTRPTPWRCFRLQLRAAPNEARSGAALGKPPGLLLPLGSLAAEWLPHRRRRHAWVLSRRGVPVGVVGIRMRAGGSCWEVDRLHVARNREEDALDLLEEAAAAAGGLGAHRVFLRLSVDSRVDAEARAANFHVSSTDDLYYRPKGPSAVSANGHGPARPARAEDLHDLFRVYLRAFLGRARQAEGLTFAQWADERSAPAPERRMLVYESGGEIVGYAEASPAGGRALIEIVTVPGADGAYERLPRRRGGRGGAPGPAAPALAGARRRRRFGRAPRFPACGLAAAVREAACGSRLSSWADCGGRMTSSTTYVRQDADSGELEQLLSVLPPRVAVPLRAQADVGGLLEIVLDLGRVPTARFLDREMEIGGGDVTVEDLQLVAERIGDFGQDNRAGIERTLHRISAIRNRKGKIIGLTARVGRAVFGTIKIIDDLTKSGRSVLLLGRPGVGKTTMLREVARVLADEHGQRVVVVDTSNEIAGDGDIPHHGIGRARRMQVPSPALQHEVMIEAVENHMPQVIIIDEIGRELEAQAARTIAERGVQLIATAHGNSLENLILNPTLSDLIGGIQSVTLGDEEARRRRTQKSILERKAPPTFDVLVEIQSWSEVAVHNDVAKTVDAILRGNPVPPESPVDRGGRGRGVATAAARSRRRARRTAPAGRQPDAEVPRAGLPLRRQPEPHRADHPLVGAAHRRDHRRSPRRRGDDDEGPLPQPPPGGPQRGGGLDPGLRPPQEHRAADRAVPGQHRPVEGPRALDGVGGVGSRDRRGPPQERRRRRERRAAPPELLRTPPPAPDRRAQRPRLTQRRPRTLPPRPPLPHLAPAGGATSASQACRRPPWR